jgi:UDP-glucose 4-epimerase
MRILITGGFGFVGGRLAVHLAQAGHQIILGSRHSIASPDWLPQAEVLQIPWNDERLLEHTCNGIDVIIHAAGMNAQDCTADPVSALAFNGVATARLAAAASRVGVQRFIYLSTAHVYASPLVGTISEATCPRNLHSYATSHLAGELAVLRSSQSAVMHGIVLRLSNAYGAPMHKDVNCWMLLVNDLCRQAVQTHKLVLQSSGLQHRDFISLNEVCCMVEQIIDLVEIKQVNVFNVGKGLSQSVLEMAQSIQLCCTEVLGFQPELQYRQSGEGETAPTLTYRSDYLASLGIQSKRLDNKLEINKLLLFCQSAFT